jgi:hypothetical protein
LYIDETMEVKTYDYVILMDDKPVARGKNLKKMWEEAKKKYPRRKLAIKYEYPPGILIAVIQL